MAIIAIDPKQTIKRIKPMHGGGQPPVNAQATDIHFHYILLAIESIILPLQRSYKSL